MNECLTWDFRSFDTHWLVMSLGMRFNFKSFMRKVFFIHFFSFTVKHLRDSLIPVNGRDYNDVCLVVWIEWSLHIFHNLQKTYLDRANNIHFVLFYWKSTYRRRIHTFRLIAKIIMMPSDVEFEWRRLLYVRNPYLSSRNTFQFNDIHCILQFYWFGKPVRRPHTKMNKNTLSKKPTCFPYTTSTASI